MRVINGGVQTLTEDWPGRVGFLKCGIPQSGPVDHYAHRAANLLVGNSLGEACLEVLGGLFKAQFTQDTVVAVTGANMDPCINGQPIPMWESIQVHAGDIIGFGYLKSGGLVSCLAIAGGIELPLFYGSKSTCTQGNFGGFNGRKLEKGDELKLGKPTAPINRLAGKKFKNDLIPEYTDQWELRAVVGPQGAPDYFTEEGMAAWFSQPFQVGHNANRVGYRINHPKPQFSRKGGGVGGIHPSNVILQPYNIPGTLNICGDFGTVLFVDGVGLGGYVCPLAIIRPDLWKVGQAKPLKGFLKFALCSFEEAREARVKQDALFTDGALV